MKVTKIGHFSEEEVEALSAAGKLLGEVAKQLSAGEIDELGEDANSLVGALKDVLDRIVR